MTDHIAYYLNSGSGRVLNCIKVAEAIAAAGELDSSLLMFKTPILNRCVLIKDVYRARNRHDKLMHASVKTKVYLPYNAKKAEEGGQSVFFGTLDFRKAMESLIDMKNGNSLQYLESDIGTLQVLDSIPSFAPFLLKDKLNQAGIAVSEQYFELPPLEWQQTYAYVQQKFRKILSAVLPGAAADNAPTLDRLLKRLWELNDPEALKLLAMAFGLPDSHSSEFFYNWKGVLFFAYQYAKRQEEIAEFMGWLRTLSSTPRLLPDPTNREARNRLSGLLVQAEKITKDIEDQLNEYEAAFQALFVTASDSAAFRNFLMNSGAFFQTLGIDFGCLYHAAEIWDSVTARFSRRRLDAETMQELLQILEDVILTVQTEIGFT